MSSFSLEVFMHFMLYLHTVVSVCGVCVCVCVCLCVCLCVSVCVSVCVCQAPAVRVRGMVLITSPSNRLRALMQSARKPINSTSALIKFASAVF